VPTNRVAIPSSSCRSLRSPSKTACEKFHPGLLCCSTPGVMSSRTYDVSRAVAIRDVRGSRPRFRLGNSGNLIPALVDKRRGAFLKISSNFSAITRPIKCRSCAAPGAGSEVVVFVFEQNPANWRLKLTRFPVHSPQPIPALPSMSLFLKLHSTSRFAHLSCSRPRRLHSRSYPHHFTCYAWRAVASAKAGRLSRTLH
jgi:hypothetical protein